MADKYEVEVKNYGKSKRGNTPSYICTCIDCIYAEDDEDICIMRRCIYALQGLEVYDCYKSSRKRVKKDAIQRDNTCP